MSGRISHILVNLLSVRQGVILGVRDLCRNLVGTRARRQFSSITTNIGPLARSETEGGSLILHLFTFINILTGTRRLSFPDHARTKLGSHGVYGGLTFSRVRGWWVATRSRHWVNELLRVVVSKFCTHVEARLWVFKCHAWRLVSTSARDQLCFLGIVTVRTLFSTNAESRRLRLGEVVGGVVPARFGASSGASLHKGALKLSTHGERGVFLAVGVRHLVTAGTYLFKVTILTHDNITFLSFTHAECRSSLTWWLHILFLLCLAK